MVTTPLLPILLLCLQPDWCLSGLVAASLQHWRPGLIAIAPEHQLDSNKPRSVRSLTLHEHTSGHLTRILGNFKNYILTKSSNGRDDRACENQGDKKGRETREVTTQGSVYSPGKRNRSLHIRHTNSPSEISVHVEGQWVTPWDNRYMILNS